ncbi:MAG: hypothetical protein MUP57_03050, partial [Clostridia bacterium]|nr:hypothetical protein [Clostridia bacterium]
MDKDKDDPGKALDFKPLQIFKNKRFVIIAGAILLLAVAGGIYSVVVLADRTTSESRIIEPDATGLAPGDSDAADLVEVLPQQRRDNEDSEEQSWTTFDPMMDPFAEPMKLTGVVIGGRGGTMAIVESSGSSYIVAVGDYVDDLWAVYQITRGMVVLRAHNQEVSLYLDQPPVTRSLDSNSDENDQEE